MQRELEGGLGAASLGAVSAKRAVLTQHWPGVCGLDQRALSVPERLREEDR